MSVWPETVRIVFFLVLVLVLVLESPAGIEEEDENEDEEDSIPAVSGQTLMRAGMKYPGCQAWALAEFFRRSALRY